jgi:hypothetical protein
MNARQHARLARNLVTACGGLEEAGGACRLKKSRLSDFQDPASGAFMPADVIADLEEWCGEPIYSRALFEARPGGERCAGLVAEACQTTEVAAALQGLIRNLGSKRLTENVRRQALGDLKTLEGYVRAMTAALDGEGGI